MYQKRDFKTQSEWKQAFWDKKNYLLEKGYFTVSPNEFYRELFPKGTLQSENNDGKGNIIASQIRHGEHHRIKQWIIDDSLDGLENVIGDEFGLIPPLSYFGKTHKANNAHELFAFAIDIDYVGLQQLKNLVKQFNNGIQLKPTYIVNSGKGVHIYYFLKEPQSLQPFIAKNLSDIKKLFIHRLWNDTSSLHKDDKDIAGIYQGFRCVGSQSKFGKEYIVEAFKISDNRYSLEEIRQFFLGWNIQAKLFYDVLEEKEIKKIRKINHQIPLSEAKERYPEWYQRRIIEKQPKKQVLKGWIAKKELYEWWKKKIKEEVKQGGRYFAIMSLCAYGLKCGVDDKTIIKDAYDLLPILEAKTEDEDNHFSKDDMKDALKTLKEDKRLIAKLTTRKWIAEHTKVEIPANKRNGMKRENHLKIARFTRDLKQQLQNQKWDDNNGRKTKQNQVLEWRRNNPNGTKYQCIKETKLDKKTVYKWWDT